MYNINCHSWIIFRYRAAIAAKKRDISKKNNYFSLTTYYQTDIHEVSLKISRKIGSPSLYLLTSIGTQNISFISASSLISALDKLIA